MSDGRVLLAVDGNSLVHRSFHAQASSGSRSRDGRGIWAVRGLLGQLVAAVERVGPDAIVISAAGAVDVLLVAFGAPRQEHWLDRNLAVLEIPVGIGVGGVFNYLSGSVARAPGWLPLLGQ